MTRNGWPNVAFVGQVPAYDFPVKDHLDIGTALGADALLLLFLVAGFLRPGGVDGGLVSLVVDDQGWDLAQVGPSPRPVEAPLEATRSTLRPA